MECPLAPGLTGCLLDDVNQDLIMIWCEWLITLPALMYPDFLFHIDKELKTQHGVSNKWRKHSHMCVVFISVLVICMCYVNKWAACEIKKIIILLTFLKSGNSAQGDSWMAKLEFASDTKVSEWQRFGWQHVQLWHLKLQGKHCPRGTQFLAVTIRHH